MIVVIGHSEHGRVEACGNTYVSTIFFSVMFLPVVARGSVVVERTAQGPVARAEIPPYGPSVTAGYLRAWGLAGSAAAALVAIGEAHVGMALIALVAGAFAVYGWRYGRLEGDEALQRAVYAKHLGCAVDPALFGAAQPANVDAVNASVIDGGRRLAERAHRALLDERAAWDAVAFDPEITDVALLEDALYVARVNAVLGDARMADLHAAVWRKLRGTVHSHARPRIR